MCGAWVLHTKTPLVRSTHHRFHVESKVLGTSARFLGLVLNVRLAAKAERGKAIKCTTPQTNENKILNKAIIFELRRRLLWMFMNMERSRPQPCIIQKADGLI